MLLLILAGAVSYSVSFAIGPSHMGDDIAYAFLAHYVSAGTFSQNPGDILSLRVLHIIPIGFFYAVFGAGILSSAAWDILSFTLSVLLVFLIGKEIYGEYVGLLASFLFSFFPIVAIYSLTMSDNIPMMLFAYLAVFLLLKAIKANSKKLYFAAGMAFFAPPVAMPEGFIIWIVVGAFLLIELLRKKVAINRTTLFFLYGFFVAFALLAAFNTVNAKAPLITFTANEMYYGQTWRPDLVPMPLNVTLGFYPGVMFPYQISSAIYAGLTGGKLDLAGVLAGAVNGNTVGFYFYFFALAAAYLIFNKDRKAYFPLLWFAVGLAYLQFGPQHVGLSPFTYVFSHRLDRYLTLIAAPLAVVISAALIKIIQGAVGKKRYLAIAACSLAVVFLIATAIPLILFLHTTAAESQYPQLQVANYLKGLGKPLALYADSGYGDISIYTNFDSAITVNYAYGGITDCHNVPGGSYVLLPALTQLNWTQDCNWDLVLYPHPNLTMSEFSVVAPFLTKLYLVP